MKKQDDLFKNFLTLSIPIGVQSLITSLINTVDTLMIGQLGDIELSAVGLVNQIYFILLLMTVGTISGATIFMAQFFGKKDVLGMKKAAMLAAIVISIASLAFMIGGIVFPRYILGIFSNEQELIDIGEKYFRVVAWSYLVTGISQVIGMILKNLGKAMLPLVVTTAAIIINICFNFIFIFGYFGAPAMGVEGAAWATNIARYVEVLILLIMLYGCNREYAPSIKNIKSINKVFVAQFAKVALPVTISETIWSFGTSLYSVVYYHMGYEYGAAINIAKVLENLLTSFFKGSGQAAAIIIGRELGENDQQRAIVDSRRMGHYSIGLGILSGVIMLSFKNTFLSFYQVSPLVKSVAGMMITYIALMMPFIGYQWLHISSTLRAGGDTKACMLIDNVTVWLIALPYAFVTGYFLNLPIQVVYLCLVLDTIAKCILVFLRVRSKKWIKDVTSI